MQSAYGKRQKSRQRENVADSIRLTFDFNTKIKVCKCEQCVTHWTHEWTEVYSEMAEKCMLQ